MWRDEDRMLDVLKDLENKNEKFPKTCPICNESSAHLFFYRFNENADKGGLWIWCSNCKSFVHASYKVPKWWVNIDGILPEYLSSIPDYLNESCSAIDEWINRLYRL